MKLTEHDECRIFVKFLKQIWCLYSKIANEIRTPSIKQKMFQKAEWLEWWVPDYIIIVKCCSWKRKLVLLEMKRQKGWIISQKQMIRNQQLLEAWINTYIAKWAIDAIKYIQKIIAQN